MKKKTVLKISLACMGLLALAGCGEKESYSCQSKATKEALKKVMEDEIINDMIHARGLRFANRQVLENADTDELKAVYEKIKEEYQKTKFDILDIKTKKANSATKTSECVASVSINTLPSREIGFVVKELSDATVELNITK